MNATVEFSNLFGEITPISSKSYAHRLLLASALFGEEINILNLPNSEDIEATKGCIKALGGCADSGATILHSQKCVELDARESGSTLRFILPILSALGGRYEIKGSARLFERGNKELLELLESKGMEVVQTPSSIKLFGKLLGGDFPISGSVSSQYISGLMFALPLISGGGNIIITDKLQSRNYVDMTIDALTRFGVKIKKRDKSYIVSEKTEREKTSPMTVEGDWSNGAFFLALSVLKGNILVKGLDINSRQGDKKIIEILKKMGAIPHFTPEGHIYYDKSELNGTEIDCADIPDLVPIIAVTAAFAKGETVLRNVERLKIKESNRIESTLSVLSAFGGKGEYDGEKMKIFGGLEEGKYFGKMHGFSDHRIVMAEAVMALCRRGEWEIEGAEAVAKSYPNFFEEIESLGGTVRVSI